MKKVVNFTGVLRIVGTKLPYYFEEQNGQFIGHVSELFYAFVNSINVQYKMDLIGETDFGVIDAESNMATGMVGKMIRNESDLSIVPLVPDQTNIKFFKFSGIVNVQDMQLLSFAHAVKRDSLSAYFHIYSGEVWLFIALSMFLLSVIFGRSFKEPHEFGISPKKRFKIQTSRNFSLKPDSKKWKYNFWLNIFYEFGTFLRQPVPNRILNRNRTLWIFFTMASFCLSCGFSGSLHSKQTVPPIPYYINTIEDVLNNEKMKFIILKNTPVEEEFKNSKKEIFIEIYRRVLRHETCMEVNGIINYVGQLLMEPDDYDKHSLCLLMPLDYLLELLYSFNVCKERRVRVRLHIGNKTPPFVLQFAMPISKHFVSKEIEDHFTFVMSQFFENGVATHLTKRETFKSKFCFGEDQSLPENHVHGERPLVFNQVLLAFLTLFPGIIVSLLALIIEYIL